MYQTALRGTYFQTPGMREISFSAAGFAIHNWR